MRREGSRRRFKQKQKQKKKSGYRPLQHEQLTAVGELKVVNIGSALQPSMRSK